MKTNLDHLPEAKQQNIQTIVDVIHDEFQQVTGFANGKKKHSRIVLIILFGSYAKGTWVDDPVNGYVSDYDILVVLNRDDLVEEYKIWHTAEERAGQKVKAPVNILVHTHEEVNDKLQQGHYFFTDIKKEGVQLYRYQGTTLAEAGKLSPAEAKKIAEEHYEQWYQSAGSFLIDYGHCMDRKDLKKAAFELHQSAERFYACILLVFTNYRPKSHNLKLLHGLAMQQHQAVKNVFPQDAKFNRRCFELLKKAYVDARYSSHYSITEEELRWLEGQVKQLQSMTKTICTEKIAAYA
jgi:predicted nucleotidyltransferase/HEPN domain-containing protein